MTDQVRTGWESDFYTFKEAPPKQIRERLVRFVPDASPEQIRAWDDAIRPLQNEVGEVLLRDRLAQQYSAILEYELPMESRRADTILLVGASVMVIELKGKSIATQADLDQAAAYARDLRNYHRECDGRDVIPLLVPTRMRGYHELVDGVHVAGPDAIDDLIGRATAHRQQPVVERAKFLAFDAYRPLPTIVEAARELMESGSLRTIHRARAATAPALDAIAEIAHRAARNKSRHLVLLTGVPGAGKTLVGLQAVHAKYLDDLAVERENGRPTAPAVFLSGNGPLVQVLQYKMRQVGDGRTFVRAVRDYVRRYTRKDAVPPEHVLVFDEAQRAFDVNQMRVTHQGLEVASEPEEFIKLADRIPEWCVVIGLIGSGQEIHVGEEAGIGQWKTAIDLSKNAWTIHAPPAAARDLESGKMTLELTSALNLDTELRFHGARHLHRFVSDLLQGAEPNSLLKQGQRLNTEGLHLRITRNLETAKKYLRERYDDDPNARFGLIASSRDKDLAAFGIPNDWQSTKRIKFGPWYSDDKDAYGGHSCRLLESCVTEFGAQGLELDAALLAWGTDFVRTDGAWSTANARGYLRRAMVKDPYQLRINAYRVLLTRGRDGTTVFVPELPILDETYHYLVSAGFVVIDA